jgi:hypothetical protein
MAAKSAEPFVQEQYRSAVCQVLPYSDVGAMLLNRIVMRIY